MKANIIERIFRQGPIMNLYIYLYWSHGKYSDLFESLLPYYMAICEDSDVMPVI
jgi:hypothetical protein